MYTTHMVRDMEQPAPILPQLIRQNALTHEEWKKLVEDHTKLSPCPTEAFLPQEWDIEKGRYYF